MEPFAVRLIDEADQAALVALGWPILESWPLRLVAMAENEVLGSVQARLSARTPGRCETILKVVPGEWKGGVPGALLDRAAAFARVSGTVRLTAAYLETETAFRDFLLARGFVPFERYLPSRLDLDAFDPARFADAIRRVEAQGIRLLNGDEMEGTPENRRRVYDLEQAARTVKPFREAGPYVPPPFEAWEPEHERLFLAEADGLFVGMVAGLDWCFTGVRPEWQGQGIATALKVRALTAAKAEGLAAVETENHEDNAPMLAVNRKLGFAFGPAEVNCRVDL